MTDTTAAAAARAMTERRFVQIIIATVVVGFLALAGVVGAAAWLLERARATDELVDQTYRVESQVTALQVLVERAEAARRGYLLAGASGYRGVYGQTVRRLLPTLREIRRLSAGNPRQQQRLARLEPLLVEKIAILERSVELRRQGALAAAVATFQGPRDLETVEGVRAILAEMLSEEQALMRQRSAQQTANTRMLLLVVAIAGVMLGALAVISLWVMRRFARDLVRSREALAKLNAGLEEAVKERTADLQRANDEIQRFAYIVSHDLRSPLVNIMGFTSELEESAKPLQKLVAEVEAQAPQVLTREAKDAVTLDLPESIEFIRSSTRKMDRLINAILRLSREGRRTLNPERLQMQPLVEGVIKSLHVLAEQKGAEVRIEGELPDIVGDRVAMEQVLSNLIENALKYLSPKRPGRVVVRGRTELGRVVYEVEDNGRGIDPKDHERIFELFRRAGAQDQPGEGIGLAHVRALVYRLGGLISCSSEVDRGATFRLSLPPVLQREGTAA